MAAHNELGKWGEEMAARYLMDNGYAILERDWHYQRRDLDIIASKDGLLVIVEVRTRRNIMYMQPEESVDYHKTRSIAIAANAYVKVHKINASLRFDIITVTGTPESEYQIKHIPDAFYPPTR